MRNNDTPAGSDNDEFDEDGELLGMDGGEAEPDDRTEDPDAEPDERLIDAELGERDITLGAEYDHADDDDDEADDLADDDDDDMEMAFLQELGIDLDAVDGPPTVIDAFPDDDSSLDDEVAA